jgi:polyhydroxyalkanoate synthesis regulator phasin
MKKALKAANSTLIKLFPEKDPLALVDEGRLLPHEDQQFNVDLAESRQAIKARREEQKKFPKAYAARTAAMATAAAAHSQQHQHKTVEKMEKLRDELSLLKAQQRKLTSMVANTKGVTCSITSAVS